MSDNGDEAFSYSVVLIRRNVDGSSAEVRIDDYGLLNELLEALEDAIEKKGWTRHY